MLIYMRKRPFAKKTTNMNEVDVKKWAQKLQAIYDPLIKCAKASREIKQLLKKYDAEKNEQKKEQYVQRIIAVRESLNDDYTCVRGNLEECLCCYQDFEDNMEGDTRFRMNCEKED